jgi:hypothetical protein
MPEIGARLIGVELYFDDFQQPNASTGDART